MRHDIINCIFREPHEAKVGADTPSSHCGWVDDLRTQPLKFLDLFDLRGWTRNGGYT